MSIPHSSAAGQATPAADHSLASSAVEHPDPVPLSAATLVPVVYSGSPAMAIRLSDETASARAAAAAIASELQSLGCELLRLDSSNLADLHALGQEPRTLSHIIYNKSYDGAEMARALGSAAAQPVADDFHHGFDLQALLDVGPAVWRHCDPASCLGASSDPVAVTLQLFVDMAQLSEDTLQRYRRFAMEHQQTQAAPTIKPVSWNCDQCTFANSAQSPRCEMCGGQRTVSSATALPPPPPPPPPCVPAPPPSDGAVPAAATAPAAASAPSSPPPPLSFSVASWNILSADYAHPNTFFCQLMIATNAHAQTASR